MNPLPPLTSLDARRFETPAILKKLATASRRLAELKGAAGSIPQQSILINTLSIQEAKDSSEIENIVTTYDELFQDDLSPGSPLSPAAKEGLLDIPVLYLSRHIVRSKADYYSLLQTVRTDGTWEEWVLYLLSAVEETALEAMRTIQRIKEAMMDYKHRIRAGHKFYSQDLINNLFTHPYTKIDFIERDLKVSRPTATRYLESLTDTGFLRKQRIGRYNYFINPALTSILTTAD